MAHTKESRLCCIVHICVIPFYWKGAETSDTPQRQIKRACKTHIPQTYRNAYGQNADSISIGNNSIPSSNFLSDMEIYFTRSSAKGKKVFSSHMPKQGVIQALALSGKFDYVFSGHTHAVVNEKYENGVLVLNPGEACGYLTGKGSFAIVDTKTDKAEIIYL